MCYRSVRVKPVFRKRDPVYGINKRTLTLVEGTKTARKQIQTARHLCSDFLNQMRPGSVNTCKRLCPSTSEKDRNTKREHHEASEKRRGRHRDSDRPARICAHLAIASRGSCPDSPNLDHADSNTDEERRRGRREDAGAVFEP